MKHISAGVIVTDGTHILLGHATGQSHWDIPKGLIDRNETAVNAAVRELREETGIRALATDLKEIGLTRYSKRKDLHLFMLLVPKMPDINSLRCTSCFRRGRHRVPEIDGYSVATYEEIPNYCVANMARALLGVL